MVDRIQKRISSAEFLNSLQALDARDEAPYNRYKAARDRVVKAEGLQRARIWMKYQIMEPRFDGALSGMPNLGVTETEAEAITAFLLGRAEKEFLQRLKDHLPKNDNRGLAVAFGAGILVRLPLWFALWWLARLSTSRRNHYRF